MAGVCGVKGNFAIDEGKRQTLLKKVARAKLSRSREGGLLERSFASELKVRRLQNNNRALAKELASQRHIAQSWYNEVLTLRNELYESTKKKTLASLQACNTSFDYLINIETQKRIQELLTPLEENFKRGMDASVILIEAFSNVKEVLCKLKNIAKRTKRSSGLFSLGSGSKCSPLMSNTPNSSFARKSSPLTITPSRSPRKKIVHPMIDGHVLQPAMIHIPRMTLEEQRRYRLQERAELLEEQGLQMSIIGEDMTSAVESNSLSGDDDDDDDDPDFHEELSELRANYVSTSENRKCETPPMEEVKKVGGDRCEAESPENCGLSGSDSVVQLPPPAHSPHLLTSKNQCSEEDPLEGTSWMYNTKKKPKRKKVPGRARRSKKRQGKQVMKDLSLSSDSDEEYSHHNPYATRGREMHLAENVPDRQKSSPASPDKVILSPSITLVRLDDTADSRISRRTKKSKGSRVIAASNPGSLQGSPEANGDFLPGIRRMAVELPSFIAPDLDLVVNTSHTEVDSKSNIVPLLEHERDPLRRQGTLNTKLEPEVILVPDACTKLDSTCIANTSMDLTQCLPKLHSSELDPLAGADCQLSGSSAIAVDGAAAGDSVDTGIPKHSGQKTKFASKDGFASSLRSSEDRIPGSKKFFTALHTEDQGVSLKPQRSPFDVSLMEKTQVIQPFTRSSGGKDDILPGACTDTSETRCNSATSEAKIMNVSVVVTDIMKTLETPSQFSRVCYSSKKSSTLCKLSGSSGCRSSRSTKKKVEKGSPCGRNTKKRKKMLFTVGDSGVSGSEDSDTDSWSPRKRKSATKLKKKTNKRPTPSHNKTDREVPTTSLSQSTSSEEPVTATESSRGQMMAKSAEDAGCSDAMINGLVRNGELEAAIENMPEGTVCVADCKSHKFSDIPGTILSARSSSIHHIDECVKLLEQVNEKSVRSVNRGKTLSDADETRTSNGAHTGLCNMREDAFALSESKEGSTLRISSRQRTARTSVAAGWEEEEHAAHTEPKSPSQGSETSSSLLSECFLQTRPRRAKVISYKEPNLSMKMRRSGSPKMLRQSRSAKIRKSLIQGASV